MALRSLPSDNGCAREGPAILSGDLPREHNGIESDLYGAFDGFLGTVIVVS